MKRPNINLHIEELVLQGFAPNDRYAIVDAVQQELSRLLTTDFSANVFFHSLAGCSDIAHADVGNFHVAPGAKANSIGTQIARSIHGGLSR